MGSITGLFQFQTLALRAPSALLAAEPQVLVSWWKPIVLLVPLVGWAWVISRIYDKHAARFFLPQKKWNATHLAVGLIAFAVAVLMPIQGPGAFWAGLGAMIVILGVDLVAYAMVANRDERVPEQHHIRFNQFFEQMAESRKAKAEAKKQGKVELTVKRPDKSVVPAPTAESPEFGLRVAAESVLLEAMRLRASQIDIAPAGKDGAYGVSYLVDGVRQPGQTLPAAEAVKLVDFWKGAAALDLAERRKKQSGDVQIEQHRGDTLEQHKIRLTTIGAQGGIRATMLFDPEKAVRRKLSDLGLLEAQTAELQTIVDDPKGVVLLAAPADGGRTTTMYTIVKMHDAYTSNVQTVEAEPQDSPEGVRQNRWDETAEGPEYSTLVRSILRRDPQVLAVAELPDTNTAKEIVRADLERTRIYVSVRADSALAAVQGWLKAAGDADAAAKALHGVVAQRLLRKLCINCRVAYQPSPDMLKKLGLPTDKVKQLFKKGGQVLLKNKNQPEVCPVCHGVGYIGQEGVFEVYRIGDAERAMMKAGNISGLKAEFRKKQLPTIQQAALRKAVEGTTSIEEVLRVTAEGKPGAGPSGQKPRPTTPAASA